MKNSKLRKALMLAACAVLLVCLSVGATLAYLTSTTQVVKNTFTVGKVEIDLDETDVTVYGEKDTDNRVKANEYKLLPGHTYIKDPTVHVKAGSEPCYVRVIVTVENLLNLKLAFPVDKYPTFYAGDLFLLQMLCGGWDDTTWLYQNGTDYEFWYKDIVDASKSTANIDLDALFDTITVPGDVNEYQLSLLDTVNINIVANAIQADGFVANDNGTAMQNAWAAWDDTSDVEAPESEEENAGA